MQPAFRRQDSRGPGSRRPTFDSSRRSTFDPHAALQAALHRVATYTPSVRLQVPEQSPTRPSPPDNLMAQESPGPISGWRWVDHLQHDPSDLAAALCANLVDLVTSHDVSAILGRLNVVRFSEKNTFDATMRFLTYVEATSSQPLGDAVLTWIGRQPALQGHLRPTSLANDTAPRRTLHRGLAREAPAEPVPPARRFYKPSVCENRESIRAHLHSAFLPRPGSWHPGAALLHGGAGNGKSTIARDFIASEEVEKVFGSQRYLIECEGARTIGAVIQRICAGLLLPHQGPLEVAAKAILDHLEQSPTLLILDHIEDLVDHDEGSGNDLALQGLLSECARRASVLFLMRGDIPNWSLECGWRVSDNVQPLEFYYARSAFLKMISTMTQQSLDADDETAVDDLVHRVDGHPLSIWLLANLAHCGYSPRQILAKYIADPQRTMSMIKKRTRAARKRITSLETSIHLSLAAEPMRDAKWAYLLCYVLSLLPPAGADQAFLISLFTGWATEESRRHDALWFATDLEIAEALEDATMALRQVGLAFVDPATGFVRMLAPIRDFVSASPSMASPDPTTLLPLARLPFTAVQVLVHQNIDAFDFYDRLAAFDPGLKHFITPIDIQRRKPAGSGDARLLLLLDRLWRDRTAEDLLSSLGLIAELLRLVGENRRARKIFDDALLHLARELEKTVHLHDLNERVRGQTSSGASATAAMTLASMIAQWVRLTCGLAQCDLVLRRDVQYSVDLLATIRDTTAMLGDCAGPKVASRALEIIECKARLMRQEHPPLAPLARFFGRIFKMWTAVFPCLQQIESGGGVSRPQQTRMRTQGIATLLKDHAHRLAQQGQTIRWPGCCNGLVFPLPDIRRRSDEHDRNMLRLETERLEQELRDEELRDAELAIRRAMERHEAPPLGIVRPPIEELEAEGYLDDDEAFYNDIHNLEPRLRPEIINRPRTPSVAGDRLGARSPALGDRYRTHTPDLAHRGPLIRDTQIQSGLPVLYRGGIPSSHTARSSPVIARGRPIKLPDPSLRREPRTAGEGDASGMRVREGRPGTEGGGPGVAGKSFKEGGFVISEHVQPEDGTRIVDGLGRVEATSDAAMRGGPEEDGLQVAVNNLIEDASRRGANGVLSIRVRDGPHGRFLVSGDAVVLDDTGRPDRARVEEAGENPFADGAAGGEPAGTVIESPTQHGSPPTSPRAESLIQEDEALADDLDTLEPHLQAEILARATSGQTDTSNPAPAAGAMPAIPEADSEA